MILNGDRLREFLLSDRAPPEALEVKIQNEARRIENIAILTLKKYIDQFYRRRAQRFETKHINSYEIARLFDAEGRGEYPYKNKKEDKISPPSNGNWISASVVGFLSRSLTPYEELRKGEVNFPSKDEWENRHVLFLDDEDWPGKLLGSLSLKEADSLFYVLS